MGKHHIDKLFEEKLVGHSVEMDNDAIWKSLELNKKKERNRKWAMIWFLYIPIVGLLVFVILPQKETTYTIESAERKNRQIEQIHKTKSVLHHDEQNVLSTKAETTHKDSHKILPVRRNSATSNTILSNQSQSALQRAVTSLGPDAGFSVADTEKNAEKHSQHLMENGNRYHVSTVENLKPARHRYQTFEVMPSLWPDLFKVPKSVTRIPSGLIFDPAPDPKKATDRVCKDRLHLEVHSGVHLIERKMIALNPEESDFVSLREATEKPLELFTLGVGVKYKVRDWYIKGGLEFQSINERFRHESSSKTGTIDLPNQIVSAEVSFTGDTTYQYDVAVVDSITSKRWLHHNNHRILALPIGMGYQQSYKAWSFSLEALAMIKLRHKFVGKQLKEDLVVSSDLPLSDGLGFGFRIGAALQYRVSPQFSVYLSPQVSFYKRSIVNSDSYLQKYGFHGMQGGISYSFNDN